MLIFERKNTVGGASALFLFVETTGWWTGKRGGNGRGDVQAVSYTHLGGFDTDRGFFSAYGG